MKRTALFIPLFFSALLLSAQSAEQSSAEQSSVEQSSLDYRNADMNTRLSYSFGMLYASNLRQYPLEFNYAAFAEGFRAMYEDDNLQFTEWEAEEYIENAMQEIMYRMSEENRLLEEQFLYINSQREEVYITESGLQYEILADSEGEKPTLDSVVYVNYTGSLIDGSVFDSSYQRGNPEYFYLSEVFSGWAEGLMLMTEGSRYILYIPSALAFGRNGIQDLIPQYSTLIFEVELLEILDDNDDFYW